MLCKYSHTKSESLAQVKSILSLLKYSIFSRGLFFIGAPCIYLNILKLVLFSFPAVTFLPV